MTSCHRSRSTTYLRKLGVRGRLCPQNCMGSVLLVTISDRQTVSLGLWDDLLFQVLICVTPSILLVKLKRTERGGRSTVLFHGSLTGNQVLNKETAPFLLHCSQPEGVGMSYDGFSNEFCDSPSCVDSVPPPPRSSSFFPIPWVSLFPTSKVIVGGLEVVLRTSFWTTLGNGRLGSRSTTYGGREVYWKGQEDGFTVSVQRRVTRTCLRLSDDLSFPDPFPRVGTYEVP